MIKEIGKYRGGLASWEAIRSGRNLDATFIKDTGTGLLIAKVFPDFDRHAQLIELAPNMFNAIKNEDYETASRLIELLRVRGWTI